MPFGCFGGMVSILNAYKFLTLGDRGMSLFLTSSKLFAASFAKCVFQLCIFHSVKPFLILFIRSEFKRWKLYKYPNQFLPPCSYI